VNVSVRARRALRVISASSLLIASLGVVPASATANGYPEPPPVPFNITLAGSDTTLGDDGVALQGDYAYLACESGLRIVDVSDPGAPSEVASLPLAEFAIDVDVVGDYAYVAGASGLAVVDVSDPTAPVQVGALDSGFPATHIAVEGSRVYLAEPRGVSAIDVSTPAAPTFVTLWATPDICIDVAARGTDVYVVYTTVLSGSALSGSGMRAATGSSGNATLVRLSAANPATLTKVNEHGIPSGLSQVAVGDGFVGVTVGSWDWGGVKLFDVAEPGSLDYVRFYETDRGTHDIAIDGTRMFLACEDSVQIVDVSDLGSPYLLGWHPQIEDSIAGLGDLMVGTHPDDGLHVFTYEPVSERTFGASRYETAVELSGDIDSAPCVVLATGASYPDALAGSPLAYALGGPILLVSRDGIPAAVADEIERLGATSAVVLGGTGALGQGVIDDLGALGITDVTRIAGATRFETSALIAEELQATLGGGPLPLAFVATGRDYPDALAAGGVAARMGAPILLVEPGSVPDAVAQTLDVLGCTDTVVLGGTGAVGAAAFAELPSPQRLSGATRFDTARIIADYALGASGAGFAASEVFVVTGSNFPDALPCGVVSALSGGPTVLVSTEVPQATNAFLTAHKAEIDGLRIVGGSGAISTNVERLLVSLVN